MTFSKGDKVYAIGPGLGTFAGWDGKSAVVEVDGYEYVVPEAAVSPTTEAHDVDCTCAGCGVCEDWNTVPSGPRAE